MEYKSDSGVRLQPRIIIHGGAGNISRTTMTPERYQAYQTAMLEIITRTGVYMTTPVVNKGGDMSSRLPSALETATFAVMMFEDNPLFNSGRGAVFTRDGINVLEASIMVSKGRAKRGVGVTGLRRVKNPILLARYMLEHGDEDLARGGRTKAVDLGSANATVDVPSAQGHTLLHGPTAETLAEHYGLPLVDPSYFFTQNRWDEHVRALEREKKQSAGCTAGSEANGNAHWSPDEFLPQGTCGAVALDADGIVCCATTTGGLTNKLTGRIGDTPIIGAGSWAETWEEDGDPTSPVSAAARPLVELSGALRCLLADCLPGLYQPLYTPLSTVSADSITTRSIALSGTGNGDSFLRVGAAHKIAAMAQFRPMPSAQALSAVAGPGGVLQQSAADRWGRTGEGEGGLIGIEATVVRSSRDGSTQQIRTTILQDCNCGGMFRAWIDDDGQSQVRVFRDDMH